MKTKQVWISLVLLPFCLSSVRALAELDPIRLAEDNRQADAPALQAALTDPSPVKRAKAALAWGRIQKPEGIDPLLKLLRDKNTRAKEEAIFALGQLAWDPQFAMGRETEIATAIEPLLSDKNTEVRRRAAEAIGKLAMSETPKRVAPALHDTASAVRAEAAMALFRYRFMHQIRKTVGDLPTLPEESLHALKTLAGDRDAQVRRNVAYGFTRIKEPRGIDIELKLIHDSDVWVRYFAVVALGKMENSRASSDVVRAAADSSPYVRLAAVNAARALKTSQLLPARLAKDPNPQVRSALAKAYGESEQANEAVLTQLNSDKSPMVQAEALKALAIRKKLEAPQILANAYKDSNWVIRLAAVEGSSVMETTREAFLLSAQKDPDVHVRAAVLEGLGTINTATAFQAIRKGLESEELSERGSAIGALAERKEREISDLAWKTYQNCGGEKWAEVREDLVDLIIKAMGEESTTRLKTILGSDPSRFVGLKALRALKERGVTDLPPLPNLKLSHSPFESLAVSGRPVLALKTSKGWLRIQLDPKAAPIHVATIVGFARQGFYNGLLWHRVVPGFVLQGGDPSGTGWGNAGFNLRAEINPLKFQRGTLGMPRAQGFDTGGIQLFVTHVPTPHLDGQYTVFGHVISGEDALDQLEVGDKIIKASIEN